MTHAGPETGGEPAATGEPVEHSGIESGATPANAIVLAAVGVLMAAMSYFNCCAPIAIVSIFISYFAYRQGQDSGNEVATSLSLVGIALAVIQILLFILYMLLIIGYVACIVSSVISATSQPRYSY